MVFDPQCVDCGDFCDSDASELTSSNTLTALRFASALTWLYGSIIFGLIHPNNACSVWSVAPPAAIRCAEVCRRSCHRDPRGLLCCPPLFGEAAYRPIRECFVGRHCSAERPLFSLQCISLGWKNEMVRLRVRELKSPFSQGILRLRAQIHQPALCDDVSVAGQFQHLCIGIFPAMPAPRR